MTAFTNTIDLLRQDVGDALRDIEFRRFAQGRSLGQLREAVTAQLERLRVDVTVVDVTKQDPSLPINDFRLMWQSKAGGPYEEQHFSLTIPNEGWYVERWDQSGTKAKTSWMCGMLDAQELVSATIRRGETARVRPSPSASAGEVAAMHKLGRVEAL
jgi:hypothetical protein